MKSYELEFHEKALKEWRKLDASVRDQLKKKLVERLENPHVPMARLSGSSARYKIKIKKPGMRLVYEVMQSRLVVQVLAVGKRENDEAYMRASRR